MCMYDNKVFDTSSYLRIELYNSSLRNMKKIDYSFLNKKIDSNGDFNSLIF
jgi:hypothetical protein